MSAAKSGKMLTTETGPRISLTLHTGYTLLHLLKINAPFMTGDVTPNNIVNWDS